MYLITQFRLAIDRHVILDSTNKVSSQQVVHEIQHYEPLSEFSSFLSHILPHILLELCIYNDYMTEFPSWVSFIICTTRIYCGEHHVRLLQF